MISAPGYVRGRPSEQIDGPGATAWSRRKRRTPPPNAMSRCPLPFNVPTGAKGAPIAGSVLHPSSQIETLVMAFIDASQGVQPGGHRRRHVVQEAASATWGGLEGLLGGRNQLPLRQVDPQRDTGATRNSVLRGLRLVFGRCRCLPATARYLARRWRPTRAIPTLALPSRRRCAGRSGRVPRPLV
jgi:hypothetical protein